MAVLLEEITVLLIDLPQEVADLIVTILQEAHLLEVQQVDRAQIPQAEVLEIEVRVIEVLAVETHHLEGVTDKINHILNFKE